MIKEDGEGLLLLVSQPRSGSTVLQKIISNNKYIQTSSEPWILLHHLSLLRPELISSPLNFNVLANAALDFYKKSSKSPNEHIRKQIVQVYNSFPNTNSTMYFLDKTPRYYEILNEVIDMFPKAKIIILLRNPFDVLKSIARTWKLSTYDGLFIFARDILFAPEILLNFSEKQKLNKQIFTIRFEELFDEAHTNIKKLYNWLNIPFEESYLNYKDNQKAEGLYGDKTFSQVSDTLTSTRIHQSDMSFMNPFWQEFMEGYSRYLDKSFLKKTGYNSPFVAKKTRTFSDFLDYYDFKTNSAFSYRNYKIFQQGQKIESILRKLNLNK